MIPLYIKEIVEEVARLARSSPHVNQQSGVSVRMSIANLENVVSNAERRCAHQPRARGSFRGSPTSPSAAASSRGKLELTMSEDDGHEDKLIHRIIDEAIKNIFTLHLDVRELRPIVEYFESGQSVEVGDSLPAASSSIASPRCPACANGPMSSPLGVLASSADREAREAAAASAAEFILEGLHVHNKLNKSAKAGDHLLSPLSSDRGEKVQPLESL